MSRPRFIPSESQRQTVRSMAAYGITQEEIARCLGVTAKTLRRHFREELDRAATDANAQVAQTLFKMAKSGKCPAATIFWLKCRARWRERGNDSGETPPSVPFIVEVVQKPEKQVTPETSA